jgi:sugar/nucleoside kinase (ribokinase family)
MTNLTIAETKTTPSINFDAQTGVLNITGESYPDSALQFYQQVLDWLNHYLSESAQPITMNFKFSYFNTSTSKCILDVLSLLESAYAKGRKVEVMWHYRQDDEDMQESGEEFAQDINLPFSFVSY